MHRLNPPVVIFWRRPGLRKTHTWPCHSDQRNSDALPQSSENNTPHFRTAGLGGAQSSAPLAKMLHKRIKELCTITNADSLHSSTQKPSPCGSSEEGLGFCVGILCFTGFRSCGCWCTTEHTLIPQTLVSEDAASQS